jgi:chemotaxis protein methyltransferase CheR
MPPHGVGRRDVNALAGRGRSALAATVESAVIGEAELQRFQDFFYRKTGIQFGPAKRYFVDRRLNERMAETGAPSLHAYLQQLRYDDSGGQELQRLINALTVNETYFYREEYQFRCLVNSMLPELAGRLPPGNGRVLRLWSLPCSTGEEPYSMAIQMLENWKGLEGHDVEIVASDIDTRVLCQAKAGLYDDRSLQYLPPAVRARYFTRTADQRWQIANELRASVSFGIANLSHAVASGGVRRDLLSQPAHLF